MKTFKILYDFCEGSSFNLGRAIVVAESEQEAEEMFKYECENYSDIITIDELKTKSITWAY